MQNVNRVITAFVAMKENYEKESAEINMKGQYFRMIKLQEKYFLGWKMYSKYIMIQRHKVYRLKQKSFWVLKKYQKKSSFLN